MIKIVTGDDRVKAQQEIKKNLGARYEVFEGKTIDGSSLPSIFLGTSLFSPRRNIVIKDFSENKGVFKIFLENIEDYLRTDSNVIFWEEKFDKRTVAYKEIKKHNIEIMEFKLRAKIDSRVVFGIYDMALMSGERALTELSKIEREQDPYMFFGLLVSQAMKKFELKNGAKEKRVLLELSDLDILMKTTSIDPWVLIRSFLLRLSLL